MKWLLLLGSAFYCSIPSLTAQTKAERGLAGTYSDAFHGRTTASGEKYNKEDLTGAHKTLPFGTRVTVTLLETGASTTVRINDRGPYDQGRIIDLSRKASAEIGLDKKGYAEVKIEISKDNQLNSTTIAKTERTVTTTTANATTQTEPTKTIEPVTVTKTEPKPSTTTVTKTEPKTTTAAVTKTEPKTTTTATTKTEPKPVVKSEPKVATTTTKPTTTTTTATTKPATTTAKETANMEQGGLYKMQVLKMPEEGFGVQVAGFSDYDAVTAKVAELQEKWFKGAMVYVDELNKAPYYRVILGPFFTKEEANSYSESLKSKYKMKDAFVVDLKALKN